MFPWSPEFAWDAYHVFFFGALYGVLATVALALALAGWRARADARQGRAAAIAWHVDFEELPASSRACRHQLTGEAPGRTCDNGFECRRCAEHARLEALRRQAAPARGPERLAFDLPLDRLYHRGHTWVRPEPDGTLGVGLDDVARRLVGTPERIEPPAVGSRLEANGPALSRLRERWSRSGGKGPVSSCASTPAGSPTSGTCCPGPRSRPGRCASWSGCSGPWDRAPSAPLLPTAASWSPTWGQCLPATATTPCWERCSWSRRC
jgi:hypothetical protein